MVFSSIQAYLDPSHWQQQLNPHIELGGTSTTGGQQPAPSQSHGLGGPDGPESIRPGSMAERARMANIPMPEMALKCPRCESTNTKFCYFNNYNLSQPRHFCKNCRRYWTRGGSLRNVPVGGGCRRNKRSKVGRSSKSCVGDDKQNSSSSTSSVSLTSSSSNPGSSILGITPSRFMAPVRETSDQMNYGEIGLNYGSMSAPTVVSSDQMNFQTMNNSLGGGYMVEQWRQQAPHSSSVPGVDLTSNLYPFQGMNLETSNYVSESGFIRPKNMLFSPGLTSHMASVKMEDSSHNNSNQQLDLPRHFSAIQGNNHLRYWGNTTSSSYGTDLSRFSSSSSGNPL